MRNALLVLLAAAFTASAHAAVDIFVTSANPLNAGYIGGLTNPALNLDPTGDARRDESPLDNPLYVLDRRVAFQPTPTMPTINPLTDGDTLYIWFQFNHENSVATQVQGIHIGWRTTPPGMIADLAYYVVDNTLGDSVDDGGATVGKRWDGAYTGPNDPEFKQNPQILAAVQTIGLPKANAIHRWDSSVPDWSGGSSANMPGENLQGQYLTTAPGRSTIFLLGAIKVLPGIQRLTPYIGELGISYQGGVQFETQNVYGFWTPEPAGVLLLALPGFALRRR
jgi:hypothetical protein